MFHSIIKHLEKLNLIHLVSKIPQSSFSHSPNEYIYFDEDGQIYKQTFDQFNQKIWTILSNQNNVLGWYYIKSPYVNSSHQYPSGSSMSNLFYGTYAFHTNNLSYFINQSGLLTIFLHSKDNLIAHINPLSHKNKKQHSWTIKDDHLEWSDTIIDELHSSSPISNLIDINPTSSDFEYRQDQNGVFYTKQEFFDYYGGFIEWSFQHPRNILKRNIIIDMYSFESDPIKINSLLDKLISI